MLFLSEQASDLGWTARQTHEIRNAAIKQLHNAAYEWLRDTDIQRERNTAS